MSQNVFFTIVAIIFVVFGVGQILAPQELMGLYGLNFNPAGVLMTRVFGTVVIGLAIIYWACRNAAASPLLQAVIYAGVISNAADVVVAWYGISTGVLNTMGWALVILHALLTIGFAYFAFGKR
jgi:hypothetical protein